MAVVGAKIVEFHNAFVSRLPGKGFGSQDLLIEANDPFTTKIAKIAAPALAVAGVALATGLLGKITFARVAVTYIARAGAVAAAWAVAIPVIGVVSTVAQKAFYGTIGHDQRSTSENIARLALPVIAGVVAFFFAPAKLVALIPVKPLLARVGLGAVAAAFVSAVANTLFNRADDAAKKAQADKEAAAKEASEKAAAEIERKRKESEVAPSSEETAATAAIALAEAQTKAAETTTVDTKAGFLIKFNETIIALGRAESGLEKVTDKTKANQLRTQITTTKAALEAAKKKVDELVTQPVTAAANK